MNNQSTHRSLHHLRAVITISAAPDGAGSELTPLLAWIDAELEYHQMMMDSINMDADEPEEKEFQQHNIDHMRLTQIREIVADRRGSAGGRARQPGPRGRGLLRRRVLAVKPNA